MAISIQIGAPSLTGKRASTIISAAFGSVDFPLTARIINNSVRSLSFPEIPGLILKPASDEAGRFKIVTIRTLAAFHRLGSSIERIAEIYKIGAMVVIEQVISPDESAFMIEQAAISDAQLAAKRVETDVRDGDQSITAVSLAPFIVAETVTLNRVAGSVGTTQSGKLVEIGIYNQATNALLVTTGKRDIPQPGGFEFAHKKLTLTPGKYFYAISCNGTTATFGHAYKKGGFTADAAMPLASELTNVAAASSFPALKGYSKDLPKPIGFIEASVPNIKVYGANGAHPWGLNSLSNKMCYSTTNGATYTDMMSPPALGAASIIDILFSATKMYVLLSDTKIFESSNLTNTATWTDITCPISAGLKRSVAKAKPYSVALFSDYLFFGEYAMGTAGGTGDLQNDLTDPGAPRILKYGPLSGAPVWTLSKQLINARRIHALHVNAAGDHLWASVGDTTYGADIGLWRLTYVPTENWTQWTSAISPNTDYYASDLVEINPGNGGLNEIYGASPIIGQYLVHAKSEGKIGFINVSKQLINSNSEIAESAKSMVVDANKNAFFFSESANPFLHVSPAPYTQSKELASVSDMAFIGRSVISGDYLINFNKRWKIPKFPWQK